MPTTSDLAQLLKVAPSTAVLWCDRFDRFAELPIARQGKIRARMISDEQMRLIAQCHYECSLDPSVNLEEEMELTLGMNGSLRSDLQQAFDDRNRFRPKLKFLVQPSTQIKLSPPIEQPNISRSRGTVTEIARNETSSEPPKVLRDVLLEFQNHNQKQAEGFQQMTVGLLERFQQVIAKNDKSPLGNSELTKLKEQIEWEELILREKLIVESETRHQWRMTPLGHWLELVSYRAAQILVIVLCIAVVIGGPLFVFNMIRLLARGQ